MSAVLILYWRDFKINTVVKMVEDIEDQEIDEISIRAMDAHKKVFKRLSEL